MKMACKFHLPFLFAFVLTLGCSGGSNGNRPPTYPVSGTITLNGKPVDGATVTFEPMEGKGSAVGSTDAQGKYNLSTFNSGDGAIEGQFKVSISKYLTPVVKPSTSTPPGTFGPPGLPDDYSPPVVGSGASRGASAGPKNELPAKYANVETSALRATVDKKSNTIDFEMK